MGAKKSEKQQSAKNWLQYVTEQSWEPELLISGLAIFASLQLPDLFWKWYQYYQYNLQSGSGVFDELLPLLIYSVFTSIAYILAITFISHFVVRAFWVGFVGLLSVYPSGIKFEELPYSRLYKFQARKKLGSAENMATKLDNISSLIFSIAFSVVLVMIAVSLIYLIFFLLYNVLKLYLGPEIFETYADILFLSISIFAFLYIAAISILNLKRFRNKPKVARWHFYLSWWINAIIMPLVHKPVQYISLTFLSNISTRRFFIFYFLLLFSFSGILIWTVATTLDSSFFDARNFHATQSSFKSMSPQNYTHNITEDDFFQKAVVDGPTVSSNLLSVFIPYPKLLDEKLNQFCEREEVADSLENFEKRRLINEQNIECADRFFSLSIDDSLQLEAEWIFSQHPKTGQKGFQTFSDISNLSPGKHNLHVNRLSVDKADSSRVEEGRPLTFENIIPFWKETD